MPVVKHQVDYGSSNKVEDNLIQNTELSDLSVRPHINMMVLVLSFCSAHQPTDAAGNDPRDEDTIVH
jgi:hypothetical protein